jgi:O-antigen ligase
MQNILLVLCGLVWFLILFYKIDHRGFWVLLLWILIAPIATNLVQRPSDNPFFESPKAQDLRIDSGSRMSGYLQQSGSIRVKELLEPTRLLMMTFFTVFCLKALIKGTRQFSLDRTEIRMGIFSAVAIASVLFQSVRTEFGLRIIADVFIVPFLAYYTARRLVTSENRFRQFTWAIACLGLYLIIITFTERLMRSGLTYRLGGPLGGSALHVVLTVIFFTVVLDSVRGSHALRERMVLPNGVRKFILCLVPVIILLTWSRGNWAGFILSVWVLLLLGRRLLSPSWKLGTIGISLVLLPVIVIGAFTLTPEGIEQRVSNVPNMLGRFATWDIAMREGIQRPIFGVGLNNMRDTLASSRQTYMGIYSYFDVHNSFLSLFAELGIVGLLAYLAIVASIIQTGLYLYRWESSPLARWRGIAVISIIVAYLIPSLFANTLYFVELHHFYMYTFVGSIAGLYSEGNIMKQHSISHYNLTQEVR